jgi:hypothetical protein
MIMEGNHFELERVVKNDSSGDELDNKDSETSKQIKALSHIDNAKFGRFHVRAVLISGVGFFTVK